MVRRFAIVVWWIGALWFTGGVLGAVTALFASADRAVTTSFGILVLCSLAGVAAWTVSYILGGSFRRPPAAQ